MKEVELTGKNYRLGFCKLFVRLAKQINETPTGRATRKAQEKISTPWRCYQEI